jgi:hypothetical protein
LGNNLATGVKLDKLLISCLAGITVGKGQQKSEVNSKFNSETFNGVN